MPKDHENVPDLGDGPGEAAPLKSFAADKMVRCETCLRANPPTRIACLYCGHSLPIGPASIELQKPALRPLEKWEHGYNNIVLPSAANKDAAIPEIAELLKLTEDDVKRVLQANVPLPIARSASRQEAELIQKRLQAMNVRGLILSDEALGTDAPIRLRSMVLHADQFEAFVSRGAPPTIVTWQDIVLVLEGRIHRTRFEVMEERKNSEMQMLDANQFFGDEQVIEFYTKTNDQAFRIMSNSFDFSSLAEKKKLTTAENMSVLIGEFRRYAPNAVYDQTYSSMRKILDPIWRPEQQNDSAGIKRARPGKYSVGSVTETSSEPQFGRYSRLRKYLLTHDLQTNV